MAKPLGVEKMAKPLGVEKMAKPLEHRSVKKTEMPKVETVSKACSRRQFFRLGIAGAALLTALQGGIIGSIVSTPKAAQAQPNVKNLKPFSLKKLKELDAKMDKDYERDSWENKRGKFTTCAVKGEKDNYVIATAGVVIEKMEKGMTIEYPKEPSKPCPLCDTEKRGVNLQSLYDYYEVACIDAGRKPKENPWVKVIFEVADQGVLIHTIFVDEKPKPNDSSDLNKDNPILTRIYYKEKNIVSVTEIYRRLNGEEKVAQKSR